MAVQFQDYYKRLGVDRSASADDIQKAFRKLARKYHPDINQSPGAEDRFKQLNEAHEVLRDPEKRRRYDALGANWKSGQEFTPPPGWENVRFSFDGGGSGPGAGFSGGGGFSDFFSTIFGGGLGGFGRTGRPGAGSQLRRRGQDLAAEIEITLQETHDGAVKTVELAAHPRHRGAVPDGRRSYEVSIPRGVTSGSKIRLSGQGSPGLGGGPAGDLYLKVRLRPDPRFKVQAHNLRMTLQVTPWEAALGCEISVPTLEGSVKMKIPPGTQGGQVLRLRGKGLPKLNGAPGDLLVTVNVAVPKNLSDRERELFGRLAEESEFRPRDSG